MVSLGWSALDVGRGVDPLSSSSHQHYIQKRKLKYISRLSFVKPLIKMLILIVSF